jgi:hypothetical protein
MRTARRKPQIFMRISSFSRLIAWIARIGCVALCLVATEACFWGEAAAQPMGPGSPLSPYPPTTATASTESPALASGAAPLYRIIGYERREEALTRSADLRALLGPAGYRQWTASRALLIIGGVAAFSGSIALLSTLGSLAQGSNFGAQSAGIHASNYKSYVYGFSGLLGAGAGILITGLILTLPLPPRKRTLFVPHLQIVETPRF